jgi:hypothetical protein
MELFAPIWSQVTIKVEDLAAIASNQVVLSPSEFLGDKDTQQIKLEIPTFQRGLRWREAKRKEFLGSLQAGLPIGSLVLARKPDSQENGLSVKNWLVLDGQQRIASLRILHTGFWKQTRFSMEKLEEELRILTKFLLGTQNDFEIVRDQVEQLLQTVTVANMELLDNPSKFLRALCKQCEHEYPNASEELENQLLDASSRIGQSLKVQFDALRQYPVPVLLVTPSRQKSSEEQLSTLAQVFTALNSYTPLSKYELIAAQWADKVVNWPPGTDLHIEKFLRSAIETRISETYETVRDEFEYDPNLEERDDEIIGLFDVLYALSRLTCQNVTVKKGPPGFIESSRTVLNLSKNSLGDVAFEVFGLFLLKRKPSDLATVAQKFPIGSLARFEMKDVIEAYVDACNHLEGALGEVGGSKNFKNHKPIGLIQAIVYLANLMAIERGSDFKKAVDKLTPVNESEITRITAKKRWKENAYSWWLLDIMEDRFQGADANTNAVRRTWLAEAPSLAMCNQPHLHDFAKAFVATFAEESRPLDRAPKRRIQTDKGRALLFAAYMHESLGEKGESDHVVPWKSRTSGHSPLNQPLPLNHIANWMPLEKTQNASRGNKPWAQHLPNVDGVLQKKIRNRLLIDESHFGEATAFSVDEFLTVMTKRFQVLVHRSLLNVKLGEYVRKSTEERIDWLNNSIREPIVQQLRSDGRIIEDADTRIEESSIEE